MNLAERGKVSSSWAEIGTSVSPWTEDPAQAFDWYQKAVDLGRG